MQAMKHQFCCNMPLPEFEAVNTQMKIQLRHKLLMVENPLQMHGRVFSCVVAALRFYVGITRNMDKNYCKQVSN
jgi:hypothetical protein